MEVNFPELEKKILKFWQENRFFEKSIERRKRSPNFVFYEGPPTANGKPGIHHVLSRSYKDIVCRYKTMRGFKVLRKAGWDTHGLPVELEIEKKLGLKSKKEIEQYGISEFNKQCKRSVWEYKKDWEELTERIGFWIDLKHPYITYQPEYIETVWWILKKIYQKGLLYQDYRVSHYCPRCQTVLSSHEVSQGYKRVKEPAIYVKFPLKNQNSKNKTYLLIWTTTPWTLPGNMAVAVSSKITYAKVKNNDEYLILSKERLKDCLISGKIVEEFKGKDLLGLEYIPPFKSKKFDKLEKTIWRVILGDFISLKEGTGLVHIAPAFGEEDFNVFQQQISISNFQISIPVNEEGKFKSEVKEWAGMFVKDADPLIIDNLKKRNLLFKKELYEHDYPFCWRCHSPLIYYAKKSWFIKTTAIKESLIKNNQKVNWIPSHLKEGRFGEWLREVNDWALSRERYWGTPLPVWICQKCGNHLVIGSIDELLKQKFSTNNYYLLRHGHSLRQVKNLTNCWPEKEKFPLTEKGKKEILKQAKNLKTKKIDLIFSSDLLRTKETAQIISKETGAKIIFDKRLREFDVGVFNGKKPQLTWNYLRRKKNYLKVKLLKGESLLDIQKRMYSFLKEVDDNYQEKNILVISHELPLTILIGTLNALPLEKVLEQRRAKKIKKIAPGELKKIEFKKLPFNKEMELDLHRPYVDEVKFYCPKCATETTQPLAKLSECANRDTMRFMKRVPEVIDCWFDSGSMPFAQAHWPFAFANVQGVDLTTQSYKKLIKKILFPADYISEAVDQTRGWFYTLLVVSTLLDFGPPYKNIISLSHVLDKKGEKMSKSKGNIVDPWYIAEKYGADASRWYFYTVNQPGDPKLFSEKDVEKVLRKFILTFWNCYGFFELYGFNKNSKLKFQSQNLLDKWILSRLNNLIQTTTDKLQKYNITGAARGIESFVINDVSLWYIRRSRRRFQKPKTKKELKEASQTLRFLLLTLSKLTAPFIPFLSEEIYQRIKGSRLKIKNSVHLEDWPKADKNLIDKKLEKEMEEVRKIVALTLAKRAKAKIKVRQPLQKLKIKKLKFKIPKELANLIKEEANIKKIFIDPKIKKEIELDTTITPELKEEGIIKEIIRQIQEMRKAANLKPKDNILVYCFGRPELNGVLIKNKNVIMKEGRIKQFQIEKDEKLSFDFQKNIKVDGENFYLAIKKLQPVTHKPK